MRIGTRGSALALAQAGLIAELLATAGHGGWQIVPMTTSGDRLSAASGDPSTDGSDKSRWVTELEDALADGRIDLAVHSAKDVPGELADGLALHGAPARAAAEDVLCGAAALDQLQMGARVGTSSIRRLAQLQAARADLDVVAIRGNVDTRLRKLADPGEGLDAIVLAHAGLQRLTRESEVGGVLDVERFVPAPGQGVLALEGRAGDDATSAAVEAITDKDTFACLVAERAVAQALDASCHTPLGAYAVPAGCGCLNLRSWVGLPDGSAWISDELLGGFYDPQALGQRVAQRMLAAGAGDLLRRADEMAATK
ncbi:MAG TPA: hydroxymethylbilane synthase [Solirubrobacteraceae bacterium]|jgi:hydroxymethylbilane synthase|nr:hydroxymethylbilane synthase [Solirubrobacteraceae bacterium]